MDFSHVNQGGRKSGKFVLVAALHVALGVMFVHGMNTRKLALPVDPGIDIMPVPPERVEPPPTPPEPPKVEARTEPPKLFVPVPEVPVTTTPDEPLIVDRFPPEKRTDQPPGPGPVVNDPPKVAPAQPPAMHTAVLADANACALPAYPKSSIRNEEQGTTTLALLVGVDGRVSSARVEHSSGYRELDRAAVTALSLCQFKPATNNGVPEAGWAKLAYVWKLD